MHNSLRLKQLKIYTDSGLVAYDEKFHKGVNIIRGDNSSGKSTITHFIFYVLGGAFNDWTNEAKQCNLVLAEVVLNNVLITIKRPIAESGNQPMYLYYGGLADAEKVTISGQWKKFSYNSADNKLSFSNILFKLLDIPIVYGDNNITMHQLLRLMYVDQESPTSSLFLYEQFDSGFTRQTVSELLLGIYNSDLYESRLIKRNHEKKLIEIENELKGMKKLYDNPRSLDKNYVNGLIVSLEKEKSEVENLIIELKENKKKVVFRKTTKLNYQELNDKVVKQRSIVQDIENGIRKAEYEINDSNFFLETLEHKRNAIENSLATRKYFQNFPFHYCPECLSELEEPLVNHCKLCKQEISDRDNSVIASRMLQEISFQIIESKKLKEIKINQLIDFKSTLDSQMLKLNELQKQANYSLNEVQSIREERIDSLLIRKGELDGQLSQFLSMLEISEKYDILLDELSAIKKEISKLKDSILYMENEQERLNKEINNYVETFALKLLKSDLNREDGFKEAKNLRINYYDNSIYIDDEKKKFSASSNFYLKNTARFSLFFASLLIEEMRYPRFILCDNMEDKGIEEERAQNFQKLIINTAEEIDHDNYQIIYTTSFIPSELEGTDYCVGEYYSGQNDNKSLKHIRKFK